MTRTALGTSLALLFCMTLAACGGGSGEDAKESLVEATEKAREVADNIAENSGDLANDAAAETRRIAEDAADQARDTTADGWASFQANWAEWTDDVQARWDRLSAEDIIGTEGERAQLVQLIQDKYNLARDKAEAQLDAWQADEAEQP